MILTHLKLTLEEINVILKALDSLPYRQVNLLINKINHQAIPKQVLFDEKK